MLAHKPLINANSHIQPFLEYRKLTYSYVGSLKGEEQPPENVLNLKKSLSLLKAVTEKRPD